MPEAVLFAVDERFSVEISRIAHPEDIVIFETHFGDQTYYADYGGIAKKFRPVSVLEIGVRFGYSGIALCQGALQGGSPVLYRGMDGEFFDCEFEGVQGYKLYRSNAVAAENFHRFFGDAPIDRAFFSINTQVMEFPDEVRSRQYDLINVDGDHSHAGALKDCNNCWPLLRPGGLMLIDDMSFGEVNPAVYQFIHEREAVGESLVWQYYRNERDMMLIQKGN